MTTQKEPKKVFKFTPIRYRHLRFNRKPKKDLDITDFFVFDTETGIYNKEGTKFKYALKARPEAFIFVVVYGHNYTKVIKDREEFIKEFQHERYKDKYVFAHNAEYDLTVLYDNIFMLDREAIFNGRFIACTNGNCKFADSMNIYNFSVAKLGKLVGMEKLDLNLNKTRTKILDKDIEYCIRDCKIVWDALHEMFNHVGSIKITQAALSLKYFLTFYLRTHLKISDRVKYYWNSYYGGRTEAFKLGKVTAQVFDINSSYPYAMKHCNLPNPRDNNWFKDPKMKLHMALRYIRNMEGCAYIQVHHKKHMFGFLPYRKDGKLLFPTGTFSGWWNFNEIRFALDHGVIEILKVHEFVCSNPIKYSLFSKYVDDLYGRRQDPDITDFESTRIKIFMNSLYGKFGQRQREKWIYIEDMVSEYEWIEQCRRDGTMIKLIPYNVERMDGFLVLKDKEGKEYNHSIPSFASYITSFARIRLLEKMIAFKNHGVVYCDTDSVFITKNPSSKIHQDSTELGGWKREPKIVTQINGLKNYEYYEESNPEEKLRRLKGVPKSAKEIGKGKFEYENLIKTKEGLRRNIDSGLLVKRSKIMKGTYDKRIVYADGTTKPIHLNEK